jgi:hypothetical protein
MVQELDTVVLTRDIPDHGLKQGDVGAVIHCYGDGHAFEIEFVTGEGKTAAVLTLINKDIRPMGKGEILHARAFTPV